MLVSALTVLVLGAIFATAVAACCCFADRVGQCLGVIDHPDGLRKRHPRPTPLVGGIALTGPLLGFAAFEATASGPGSHLLAVLGPATAAFMMLGWADDRYHLPPGIRLVTSTLLCTLLVVLLPELELTVLTFGRFTIDLGVLALPFTVLCLVGLKNAVNMADGLNGLVIGLSIFWVICLLLYAPIGIQPFIAILLLGLLILLPFNLKGRLFLGDSGSYTLGVLIGVLAIHVHAEAGLTLPTLTVVLWLLVPVLDCLRVMVTRVLTNRSPLAADRDHLQHRIVRYWPWPVSVLTYLMLATGPGAIAALWPSVTVPMLLLCVLGYGTVLWLTRSRPLAAAVQVEHSSRMSLTS